MIHFFGRNRFASGLHASILASLLGKTNAGHPAKGALAGRSYPRSTFLTVNQLLIYCNPALIWV
jgi:hypothetical protein